MRYYKNACQFDETRVHDDYSVIGSEFCDFLSTILTFRLLKKFEETELINSYTYKKILSVLNVNFPFFGTHPTFFFKKLHFVYPKY